ncbi:TLC domain-containing protein 3A isoform 1-T1 [Cyanocitta cristata]
MWRTLALASAFFPGLFILCIRLLRWAAPGWSLKDRILLSGRLVSTVQATMATVSGITVVLSCKNVVHDRHWLAVEYIWVLVPYMTYDIYVMYLCHWHKSQEKGILEKKHSLASVWSFLLQERLMVTHHLFILIVLTPITQVRATAAAQDPLDMLGVGSWPPLCRCSLLAFFTALQGRVGGLLCGLHLHSRAEHAFRITGQNPHAAQNAGHAAAQGERDPHPGDLLPVPHPPLPLHVRGLRPPGGDPGVPGAVPHPPALQHRQRLPHRPPALLVQAHLPQGRPPLRRLSRPPQQITELITARGWHRAAPGPSIGSSDSAGLPELEAASPSPAPCQAAPAGARKAFLPRRGSASCPPAGVGAGLEAQHSFWDSALRPRRGLHERGLLQPPRRGCRG